MYHLSKEPQETAGLEFLKSDLTKEMFDSQVRKFQVSRIPKPLDPRQKRLKTVEFI